MRRSGIRIENGWGPREVTAGSRMSFVSCVAVFDEDGQFRPVFDESRTLEIDFDQVILAVGQRVEPCLAGYLERTFGRGDRLDVDWQTMQVVGRDRIFAGGDIVRGAGTVVEAVADGRRAAMGIDARLRTGGYMRARTLCSRSLCLSSSSASLPNRSPTSNPR